MEDSNEYQLSNTLDPRVKTTLFQLERLRRNYHACIQTYDTIALMELSHSLRIWTDLITSLPTFAPLFGSERVFKSAFPLKKLTRIARKNNYVFAYMPGGVATYASRGQVVSRPNLSTEADYTLIVDALLNPDNSVKLSIYCYAETVLDVNQSQWCLYPQVVTNNFADWMRLEAVRLRFTGEAGTNETSIPRAVLIQRIANTLDGSHPSAAPDPRAGNHKADPAVTELMRHSLGGLPLPYFMLLKIAKEILEHAGRLLGIPKPEGFQPSQV